MRMFVILFVMEIEKRIEDLARKVLEENAEESTALFDALHTNMNDVVKSWIVWDTGINEYGNEIYASTAMRCAMHFHNYVKGNWHDTRQEKVLEYIKKITPTSIVDIGFGTPQRYVTEYVLKNRTRLSLMDADVESIDFAKIFLDLKSNKWNEHINLIKYDMNSGVPEKNFNLYLFQDSIEHIKNPTAYLKSLVASAIEGSYFIFCLPIEIDKAIPEHAIFWKSQDDAICWLENSGLRVLDRFNISMNPEFDYFAKFLHPDFSELLVLAQK